MNPECQGEKFGHDFPTSGADCTRCGINQLELSGRERARRTPESSGNLFSQALARAKPKPKPGIHSEIHALVDEARRMFGETAKFGKGSFGFYLGFFNRLGSLRVRQLLAECKEANDPKRAFWWKIGDMAKKQKENPQAGT